MFHRSFSLYNNMTYTKNGGAKNAIGIGNTAYAKRVYKKQTCNTTNCKTSPCTGCPK